MTHTDHADVARPRLARRGLLAAGGAGLVVAGTMLGTGGTAVAASRQSSGGVGAPVSADDYTAICQLKANYVTATDSLTNPDNADRALALYRATYTKDAESSAGYDPANPDFLVYGPDALFEQQRGLSAYLASQHNVGVIHVERSDAHGPDCPSAIITAHVLVTLVPRDTLTVVRLAATYHDEAVKWKDRWYVTKSFAQYQSTESTPRVAPPAEVASE
ncbi:nuclear transport factor 2 family protein [Nakamurella leprariae]|uniref:Nuclear transport factor 2 family protein n=1 Tax=Nakamurella leprariae TaxID=2803911 RepID=A0A938Y8K1_9ACTN|nr:nuclear transport factor 2 family protein [Nakamurella leprariae]MBM9465947.1 nuclear transport factor 2 family protein [Nakamurella leprariae]